MKKIFGILIMVNVALGALADDVAHHPDVAEVGSRQSMVRIHAADKYLMFPVQESQEDSKVEMLVNGKVEKTFYVRLANNKTDYTVPFDLTPYQGQDIIFRVTSPQGRVAPQRLHSAAVPKKKPLWTKELALADTFSTANTEAYRPAFHHTPLYGWMNDPNGMFYDNGKWHLYYQWNPYGSRWQNMTWGHSVSTDLVNWEHLPAAIEPDDLGSIFSGSSVIDHNNTAGFGEDAVIALYTSAGDYQMQSLAYSNDGGLTFNSFEGNPVITLPTEARDPNMFWNEETGLWNLVLAHALEKEILIFSSPDLKEWTLESSFGKGLGARDGVWECPDLFELEVDGTGEKKWMMIVNLNPGGPFGGSATQYFIGDFDGKTFTPDETPGGYVPAKWLDFGKDYYATVSWSDTPADRRTVIGWMSNWQYADQVPTQQFRSANSLPRDIGLFKGRDGEIYAYSKPAPELRALRLPASVTVKSLAVDSKPKNIDLPADNGGICEITMEITSKSNPVVLTLGNEAGDQVTMAYNPSTSRFTFDRTQSGVTDFNEDFPAITVAPTFENDGKLKLDIFIDRSSIEVFGNDGKFAMTNLVFPNEPYNRLSVATTRGAASIRNLEVYPLKASN